MTERPGDSTAYPEKEPQSNYGRGPLLPNRSSELVVRRCKLKCRSWSENPRLQCHSNTMLRPERKTWCGYDRICGHRAELKALRNGSQQQCGFHHCEGIPDALPGTAAEGEVSKSRQLLRAFGEPAVRIELFRLGEISGISVHDPLAHHNVRAGWNAIAANFKIFDHRSRHSPCWWIKAHGFFDYTLGVAEIAEIGKFRSAAGKYAVEFFVQPGFGTRILAEKMPRPGKRQRRGFVAGQNKSQNFIPQLFVAHASAVFVAGLH